MEDIYYYKKNASIPKADSIGGKAQNLAFLSMADIPVPEWIALTTNLFESFMGGSMDAIDRLLTKKINSMAAVTKLSSNIITLIKKKNFNKEQKEQILNIMKDVFPAMNSLYFSVRSSAVDEDSANFSFAGQLESYLYLKADNSLFKAVKECFISAYSERVMMYRFTNKVPFKGIRPAVIIQEMIFGDRSGVMFTGNPLNNDTDQILINATYGIGEGIVSGELDSDSWVLDSANEIVKERIVDKNEMVTFNKKKGSGTITQKVIKKQVAISCLTSENIQKLVQYGRTIEKLFNNVPQDIEWCIHSDKIFILQSRPITTMGHINKNKEKFIFDNSNIIESFPGVTSPFTFSFASTVYETVYHQFYELMGAPESKLKEHAVNFRNTLVYINNRIYYNINSWHNSLQLLPGYNFNRRFMDNMMGVKVSTNIESEKAISLFRKIFVELPHLLRGFFRIVLSFIRLDKTIEKFISHFYEITRQYMDEKFESYSNREIIALHNDVLVPEILKNWKAPIINDLYVMIFYGILSGMIKKLNVENADSLQNDLLCGEGEMESTKPTMEIIRISNWIRKDDTTLKLFTQSNEKKLIKILLQSDDEKYSQIRKLIKSYISEYGFRCMSELKLEEPSLKEDPAFLFTTIKNYLKKDAIDLTEMVSREKEIRTKAEQIAFKEIHGIKKLLFKRVLKNARKGIKNREELRFMRTKIFGIVRSMYNSVGNRFYQEGIIDNEKDIYFLHFDEVPQLIEGRSTIMNIVKDIVRLRKKDLEKNNLTESPERIYSFGDVCNTDFLEIVTDDDFEDYEEDESGKSFRGVPCSPGEVEGIARIVLSPQDADLNGEILVAKRTDPGWVPLFPSVSGIIIERGSVLSHSAVVAREMGIPTVVGLRGITDKIKNNERIRLNGSSGIVERLDD